MPERDSRMLSTGAFDASKAGLASTSAGQGGSARVRVLVDGQSRDLGHEGELTSRDGPLPVRLDVTSARELILEVDFGSGGDAQVPRSTGPTPA